MRRGEYVSAAVVGHHIDELFRCAKNLLRSPLRKEVLRVEASHKGESLPEFPLQLHGIHAGAIVLYRIEDVEPHSDQVGDDRADRSARVVCHQHSCALSGGEYAGKLRADHVPPSLRADNHGALAPDVVSRPEPVEGEPGARLTSQVDREVCSLVQKSP